jgi:hypothetical protein
VSLVLEFLFEVVVKGVFCWTGEVILFAVSLGKHKPHWDVYTKDSPRRFVIFSEISTLIGMIFWFVVLGRSYQVSASEVSERAIGPLSNPPLEPITDYIMVLNRDIRDDGSAASR